MKSIAIICIKLLISVGLFWFLVHSAQLDFSLLSALIDAPFFLLCTTALYLITIIICAWRWYKLNQAQHLPLSYRHTLLPTYLGIAFNNLLPGGVSGDFFRFYFLNKKISARKSTIMLSIFLDRITGLSGIFLVVCLAFILHIQTYSQHAPIFYFSLFSLLAIGAGIVLYIFSILLPNTRNIGAWLNKNYAAKKWAIALLSLFASIEIYRSAKRNIAECLLASMMIQALIAITCMLIAHQMHFPTISFSDTLMAVAITQIVNLIPIAPGGLGVGEIAFANVMTALNPGTGATYATIFLAYRIIGLLTYLPGVTVFIFDKHLLKRRDVATQG